MSGRTTIAGGTPDADNGVAGETTDDGTGTEAGTGRGASTDETAHEAADESPTRLSAGIATVAAAVSLVAVGTADATGLVAATIGAALVGVGALVGRRAAVTLGALALFAGVVAAGLNAGSPAPLLVGAVGTVVAWDAGRYGIGLGEQVGRAPATATVELRHAAATLGVGVATAGVAAGIYAVAGGGQPLSALVFLLVAALALASALA